MTKHNYLLFVITFITIFLISPPYFGYGIILLVGFAIVYSLTNCFSYYVYSLNKKIQTLFIMICACFITVLFQLGLAFFIPVMELSFGMVIYLIPICVFSFDKIITNETHSASEKRISSFKTLAYLSIIGMVFIIAREFFAFGSISYPTQEGIAALKLPVTIFSHFAFFWSTIPGFLLIVAMVLILIPFIKAPSKKKDKEPLQEKISDKSAITNKAHTIDITEDTTLIQGETEL